MESKTAFLDTNVLIAFVFIINSLHLKSKKVFEVYDELFLSKFVENEFEWRYFEKFDNLKDFFNDLRDYLENPEYDFYSTKILEDFAQNNYTGKLLNDAKSSIKPFWNQYVGMESIVSFQNLKCPIRNCLSDLKIKTNNEKDMIYNILNCTNLRQKKYAEIDLALKSYGVKKPDRTVTLDGHDFASQNIKPIDFITFDDECFNGAKNVKILEFNSIKGKNDFN